MSTIQFCVKHEPVTRRLYLRHKHRVPDGPRRSGPIAVETVNVSTRLDRPGWLGPSVEEPEPGNHLTSCLPAETPFIAGFQLRGGSSPGGRF